MIQRSLYLVRRATLVLSLGISLGLALTQPAHSAQKQESKRSATVKISKAKSKTQLALKKKRSASSVVAKKRVAVTLQATGKVRKTSVRSKLGPVRSSMAVPATAAAHASFAEDFADQATAPRLSANSVLVMDQNTHEVLFSKNDKAVLPIASLTKLMTGLLVVDAQLPLDEEIVITQDDVDTIKGSSSRLAVGTHLTRGEALHLALMSSENRAAHALGRTYPGGLQVFVNLMNRRAAELGMRDTRYVEPTGLSSLNQSSAQDLARLVGIAHQRPLLRELSTSPSYELVSTRNRVLQYRNSNRLIEKDEWNIGLQKTGYISEAGRCLVMQASVAGRQLIMVFLDAADKAARIGDAERVRHWVERSLPGVSARDVTQRPRV